MAAMQGSDMDLLNPFNVESWCLLWQ